MGHQSPVQFCRLACQVGILGNSQDLLAWGNVVSRLQRHKVLELKVGLQLTLISPQATSSARTYS